MHRTLSSHRGVAALALAFLAITACGDSTGPKSSLPSTSEAMTQMQHGFADDTVSGAYGGRALPLAYGMLGLYLGSSVAPFNVKLDGHTDTFSSVSVAETDKDSVDTNADGYFDAVSYDSVAVTVAWRGNAAQEVVFVIHLGGTSYLAAPALAKNMLSRLSAQRANPALARAAQRILVSKVAAAAASGDYVWHDGEYLTATDGYYMTNAPTSATGHLTVGSSGCTTRTEFASVGDFFWNGYDVGDTCSTASLSTGIVGTVVSDMNPSAAPKQLEVPTQTVPAIRLFIDYTNDIAF